MIGLVLVTHGDLALHFMEAMEHVVGPQENVLPICIGPQDDMEHKRAEIAAAVSKVDSGQGTIILTDLFGGTPSNLAISLMDKGNVEVIAGINLPMLIRLAGKRQDGDIEETAKTACDAGRSYIIVASELLGKEKTGT